MNDEDLAAEIRRCMDLARNAPKLVQSPAQPLSAKVPQAAAEFGFLDGRRMPLDELEAELERRLDRRREIAEPATKPVAERTYIPVVLPADRVIPRDAYEREARKISPAPAESRSRKGLYFIFAVAALAAVSAPGSWNAISRHQQESAPVTAGQPDTPPPPAPVKAAAENAAAEKAAAEKAAAERAVAERSAAERAAAKKAAAERAAAEEAATAKAAAEKKAAAERAAQERAAAARAAEPKILIPPSSSVGAVTGNLPKSTPSSTAPWLQPKPFIPTTP